MLANWCLPFVYVDPSRSDCGYHLAKLGSELINVNSNNAISIYANFNMLLKQ